MLWLKIGLAIAINYSSNVSSVISIDSRLVLLALIDRRRREVGISPDKCTTTRPSKLLPEMCAALSFLTQWHLHSKSCDWICRHWKDQLTCFTHIKNHIEWSQTNARNFQLLHAMFQHCMNNDSGIKPHACK